MDSDGGKNLEDVAEGVTIFHIVTNLVLHLHLGHHELHMILVSSQVVEDNVVLEIGNLALDRCDLQLSLIRAILNILVQSIEH